jgi:hypothetical protein
MIQSRTIFLATIRDLHAAIAQSLAVMVKINHPDGVEIVASARGALEHMENMLRVAPFLADEDFAHHAVELLAHLDTFHHEVTDSAGIVRTQN